MLHEHTECTFNPTLISKQFKNRVCPNYDLKHVENKQIATEIAQEYDYFTLKEYIKMNEESKSDLQKLFQYYSSGQMPNTEAKDFVRGGNEGQKKRVVPGVGLTEQDKVALVAQFLERSELWQESVDKKKQKVAMMLAEQRCKENTFHPRINRVSELMHQKKMMLLEQVNKAAAAILQASHANEATQMLS